MPSYSLARYMMTVDETAPRQVLSLKARVADLVADKVQMVQAYETRLSAVTLQLQKTKATIDLSVERERELSKGKELLTREVQTARQRIASLEAAKDKAELGRAEAQAAARAKCPRQIEVEPLLASVKNTTERASEMVGEWGRVASVRAAAAGSMAKDVSSWAVGKAMETKEIGKGAAAAATRLVSEVKNSYKSVHAP
uniref:Uncharacterized protein n=1 Tax=Calcidiscus leptoporus TaxID=127549 RepID=A0A7S0J554_9EUKA